MRGESLSKNVKDQMIKYAPCLLKMDSIILGFCEKEEKSHRTFLIFFLYFSLEDLLFRAFSKHSSIHWLG